MPDDVAANANDVDPDRPTCIAVPVLPTADVDGAYTERMLPTNLDSPVSVANYDDGRAAGIECAVRPQRPPPDDGTDCNRPPRFPFALDADDGNDGRPDC